MSNETARPNSHSTYGLMAPCNFTYSCQRTVRSGIRLLSPPNNLPRANHHAAAIDMHFVNKPNPNVRQYFLHQGPGIGAAYPVVCVPSKGSTELVLPSERDPPQALPTHNDKRPNLQEQGLPIAFVPVQR